jgi:hypothetical protein
MQDTAKVPRKPDDRPPGRRRWSMRSWRISCWARPQAVGVELLGPGALSRVTKGCPLGRMEVPPCTHRGVTFDSGHAFHGVFDCPVLGWLGIKRPTI